MKFLSKKQEVNSAIATLAIHFAFFVMLAFLLKLNAVEVEPPHFIQLRLGSLSAVEEGVISEEIAEQTPPDNLLHIEKKQAEPLPELGDAEKKLLVEVKEVPKKNISKLQVENEVAGSEYGNSNTGQKSATYLELLQLTVQETSQIPPAARKAKIGGNAVLRLTFNRDGYVRDYKLVQKTGYKILDDAALDVAKKLVYQPFPPMPDKFEKGRNKVTYDFPVSFKP
jgi:protein TonB